MDGHMAQQKAWELGGFQGSSPRKMEIEWDLASKKYAKIVISQDLGFSAESS